MVLVLSLVIAQSIVASLAGPVAIPAPFPGGVGPDGTRYKTAYKCEGERLTISCAADQTIKVIRANFGRFSIAICNRHGTTDMSVNCMSPSSNRVMKRKCDGHPSCSIDINSNEFGDPCPATPKYLEVHYGCVPKSTPTTKRPLPAWFLQGGSDQLWESRIPNPPEGFEEDKTSDTGKPALIPESTTVETRIPITTPTGTTSTSTTTISTTSTETTSTSTTTDRASTSYLIEKESQQMLKQEAEIGMEYYPLPKDTPEIQVKIVDIPIEDQPLHCPPSTSRNLYWNWTASSDTAIQPCPTGTTGLARWTCGQPEDEYSPVFWSTPQPDMSDCKSLSMSSLESKVEAGDLENVISAALAHHTRVETMYGGDIEAGAAIMRTLSNRIQYLLQTQGDKFYNKGQYIQEVLLNMVRAASNLLDISNRLAWKDLHATRQIKAATALLLALEENAFLFVEVTNREEVLVESSQNILMSVSIMEIGRLTNGTRLPANEFEEPYGSAENSLNLPFNVLWEQARSGITKLVHFSYRNLHEILGQGEVEISNFRRNSPPSVPRSSMSLNSRVISGSFGRGRQIQFPNSVEISLRHLEPISPDSQAHPICVFWDYELSAWSNSGCSLASSNSTHSICRCDHLASFAIMTAPNADAPSSAGFPIMTLQIVTYIVAAISVLCVVLILVKFRHNIQKILLKTPCLNQEEKHACNPRTRSCSNMGLSVDKNAHHTLQNNMMQRTINSCAISKQAAPEMLLQGQDGSMTLIQPNLYRTTFENGQPVMVTLNPYSTQLVDNLNKMMGNEIMGTDVCYDNTMNPQLAKLTATLRKKRCEQGHPGPCRKPCNVNIHENSLQLTDRNSCIIQQNETLSNALGRVNPSEVVFRAVSPHGHVYWEINPTKQDQTAVNTKSQNSSSDENTNSDLQNISDFSDDDNRAASEMSRQSSSRFSESRPLIYSSSASTSPGHSAASSDLARHAVINDAHFNTAGNSRAKFVRPMGRTPWANASPNFHEEVYAYAATDFSGSNGVQEQVQSQVQIRDCKAVPVSVKSKEYIMAKIADYTERNSNQV